MLVWLVYRQLQLPRGLELGVEAFDTRDVVEEQVNSLGAKFVKIDLGETGQTDQGYAKELTDEQINKQKELQSKVCERSDIVITTAQLFGRPAPLLIDNKTIDKMKPGSVIFDMAVESGGNVEGSKPDEIVMRNGVKIIGISNLASQVAGHASLALSNNFNNWIKDFYDSDNSKINFDLRMRLSIVVFWCLMEILKMRGFSNGDIYITRFCSCSINLFRIGANF